MISSERLRRGISGVMYGVCITFAVSIILVLALITAYLVSIGFSSLSWSFFTEVPTGDINNPGGMLHAIVGTLKLLGMASIVGIPLGILVGVYLSEYSAERWLPGPVRFIADVLAGVPSIVVGILGYELIVVPMGRFSGYAGAFALAFIMVPIVARTTEEMLRLVPHSYREASIGLGATKAQTILRVILPSATGSIVTGVMLAMARIAGETAPLLFTALGSRLMPTDPGQPFPSLTVQIYTYAVGPYEAQRKLAWAGMLVLIAILFILNLLIRFLTSRSIRRA
jgi:phosphate transport system permease protein